MVTLGAVAVMALLLATVESDMLWRVQELNLFVHTPLFFQQCMASSGGLLVWLGCYLTQYFYYPALGACLLGVCWLLLVWLLLRTFGISCRWAVVALVPVTMLLLTIVDSGYWIFYLKLRGHFFVGTLGVLVAVALTWLYRRLAVRQALVGNVFAVVMVVVGYPLFGFYGLLAGLLMALVSWRVCGRRAALATTFAVLLAIIDVPIVCYHTLYHETNFVNVYWTALPIYRTSQGSYPAYHIPYVVLVLTLVVMAVAYRRDSRCASHHKPLSIALLAVLTLCVAVFWYKDTNFRCELRMNRAVIQQDWERVVALSAKPEQPTADICMMRNLALYRLGRQGSEMYTYPQGDAKPAAPFPVRSLQVDGKQLYLYYGLVNFCYRWCIEDGVEYGWSVEGLKLLVKCALLSGEKEAALKFISLLRKTTFHRQWCQRYENFLRDDRLMVPDPELRPIMFLQNADEDYLTSDNGDIRHFMLNHFASAESSDPSYQQLALLCALQLHNRQLFWRQFYQYTELHLSEQPPRHYQEAACLFGRLYDEVDTSRMPFDREVVRRCDAFLTEKQRYDGQSEATAAAALYDRFHDTYYYDYFFHD